MYVCLVWNVYIFENVRNIDYCDLSLEFEPNKC